MKNKFSVFIFLILFLNCSGKNFLTVNKPILIKVNQPESSAKLSYYLYVPKTKKKHLLPLLVVLHGAGSQRSKTGPVALYNTPLRALYQREMEGKEPDKKSLYELDSHVRESLVLVPSSPGTWDPKELNNLIEEIRRQYPVDPDRLYVTGWSMGGWGTWDYASAFPDKVAALIPICGGSRANPVLARTPVWMFHDFNDPFVQASYSQDMILASFLGFQLDVRNTRHVLLTKTGYPHQNHNPELSAGNIYTLGWFDDQFYSWKEGTSGIIAPGRYTVTVNDSHSIMQEVYSNTDLWEWLYKQKRVY